MKAQLLSEEQIIKAKAGNPFDLGNQVLYDLCSEHPFHQTEKEILAKTWLIGRSYSVALERRRTKNEENDVFYTKVIAPAFMKSQLDSKISNAKNFNLDNNIEDIINLHFYLTNELEKMTGHKNRSFSSKYLHFHCPSLFFIYDTRALTAITKLTSPLDPTSKEFLSSIEGDPEYGEFFLRCLDLRKQIARNIGVASETGIKAILTPRELDNLLLEL